MEVQKETDESRKSKEDEFNTFQFSHNGMNEPAQVKIDEQTLVQLQAAMTRYNAHRDEIVKKLLDCVVFVEPRLHRHLRKEEWML
ncbi:unnamed protein product [Peniophora sp. CBMAI 1063]|nr:unnamed protein product [Peniophora sp. CBMAI 1063]